MDKKQNNKNKSIIEKVKIWQSFKFVKPLVCRNESCGTPVVPKESKNKVILVCPKCRAVQSYVPKSVIESDLSVPDRVKRNSVKYDHKLNQLTEDDSD